MTRTRHTRRGTWRFVGFKGTPCVLAIEWVDWRIARSWNRQGFAFQRDFHHLGFLECRPPDFETLLQLHVLTECVDGRESHRIPCVHLMLRSVLDTSVLTSPFRKQYNTATKKPFRKRKNNFCSPILIFAQLQVWILFPTQIFIKLIFFV